MAEQLRQVVITGTDDEVVTTADAYNGMIYSCYYDGPVTTSFKIISSGATWYTDNTVAANGVLATRDTMGGIPVTSTITANVNTALAGDWTLYIYIVDEDKR